MIGKLVILFAVLAFAFARPQLYPSYNYGSYSSGYPGYYGYSGNSNPSYSYGNYGTYGASPFNYGYGYY